MSESLGTAEAIANRISGSVYADVNNNGQRDSSELGIHGITIRLSGPESREVTTAADGSYTFSNLPDGSYTIEEVQSPFLLDGMDTLGSPGLGTAENDRFTGVALSGDVEATDYNFGELGLRAEFISLNMYLASSPSWPEILSQYLGPIPTNRAPDAVNDAVSIFKNDGPTEIDVLGNDTDPDGDALTIVRIVDDNTLGQVSLSGGVITYDTNGQFDSLARDAQATETFSYEVEDDEGLRSLATVTITVEGNLPPIARDDDFTTTEEATLNGNLLVDNGNGADTDANDGTAGLSVDTATNLSTLLGGLVSINGDGDFTYNPSSSPQLQALGAGESAIDSFQYTVGDGVAADSATVRITVTGVNDDPVAQDDTFTIDEDSVLSGSVIGGDGGGPDSDVDGDLLTVVNAGTFTTDAAATVVLNADGSFTYDPTGSPSLQQLGTGEQEQDTFTYEISDGTTTATATVTVTVTGIESVLAVRDDSFDTDEDTVLTGDLFADNGNGPDVSSDVGSLSIANPMTIVSQFGATVTINADGSFTYDPTNAPQLQALPGVGPNNVLADSFVYSATDGITSGGATVTVNVTGVDDPFIVEDDAFDIDEDALLTGHVFADNGNGPDRDPDNDMLSIVRPATFTSSQGVPVTLSSDGSFTYDPRQVASIQELADGEQLQDSFQYTVTDGTSEQTATVTVAITGVNDAPTLTVEQNVTVQAGAPFHLVLDGFDAEADAISYQAQSGDSSLIETAFRQGRSIRFSIQGRGDIVYKTFEDLAPRAAGNLLDLSNLGHFNGLIVHRVVAGFVFQFGGFLPGGTFSPSPLGNYDDEFHEDLQHVQPNLLSAAKGGDDTNSGQVFHTFGPTRSLDFNHSIMGIMTQGQNVVDMIEAVSVQDSSFIDGETSEPVTDIVIDSAQVFADNQNAVLTLKAPEGASGTTTVTITASDGQGGTIQRVINVTVVPDTSNGGPFLEDIPEIHTEANTPTTFQLSAVDVENDDVFFDAVVASGTDFQFTIDNDTGEVSVTPPQDFTGELNLLVGVQPVTQSNTGGGFDFDTQVVIISVGDSVQFSLAEDSPAGTSVGQVIPQADLGDDLVFEFNEPQGRDELELAADDHLIGDPAAPVVLIEYLDLQCPVCQTYHPIIEQLAQTFPDDLLVVQRHLPLSVHQNALEAAIAAEAAHRQGMFDEMVDLLFDRQSEWSGASDPTALFQTYADELGLNLAQFDSDLNDAALADRVNRDAMAANALNAPGTPTFYVNGKFINPPSSSNSFMSTIQTELDAFEAPFIIDRKTGEIRVANPAALDFDANPVIRRIVNVTDSDGQREAIEVTINLTSALVGDSAVDAALAAEDNWLE